MSSLPIHIELLEFAAALRGTYTRIGRVNRETLASEYQFHTERGTFVGYGESVSEAQRGLVNDAAAVAAWMNAATAETEVSHE